ncbi:VID27 cytoplasmic protein [Colletotrichum abscissum]|uniref:VID27 cytoplasmic protein n=1 Tax=Colletotrichum abscissum TaxID=1671311 RepID=A0A9P9XD87_9PEZI|nr:VID27 cytoplasmic protein [Colletotrichum abscissum]KAI3548671.1 VID27 cytoplasmic protein [Colletotrichum abscissum]KAK1492850.1 VID27 cytoplasmic protein [Colletotrichum abscissum]
MGSISIESRELHFYDHASGSFIQQAAAVTATVTEVGNTTLHTQRQIHPIQTPKHIADETASQLYGAGLQTQASVDEAERERNGHLTHRIITGASFPWEKVTVAYVAKQSTKTTASGKRDDGQQAAKEVETKWGKQHERQKQQKQYGTKIRRFNRNDCGRSQQTLELKY